MELLWPIEMIIYLLKHILTAFFGLSRAAFMCKRKLMRKNMWIVCAYVFFSYFFFLFCSTSCHKLNAAFEF